MQSQKISDLGLQGNPAPCAPGQKNCSVGHSEAIFEHDLDAVEYLLVLDFHCSQSKYITFLVLTIFKRITDNNLSISMPVEWEKEEIAKHFLKNKREQV